MATAVIAVTNAVAAAVEIRRLMDKSPVIDLKFAKVGLLSRRDRKYRLEITF
jgi:putative ubiquitin-RnfH superfamily antitoxin RatB of RatAB toxin-antitoxin module